VTTLVLHFDKHNKEIIIYNSNKQYFDQFVISQLRSFSHLENFSVGKEMIAFTRPL
jgi:hypothetical protein